MRGIRTLAPSGLPAFFPMTVYSRYAEIRAITRRLALEIGTSAAS